MSNPSPVLILMPGLDGTGVLFERFVTALPAGLAVRVVSYPADERLSLDDHAAVVRKVIGSDRAVLVAESFSGLVALQLLREGGVAVEKVIFVASFAAPPRGFLNAFSWLLPALARGVCVVPDFLWRLFCLGRGASAAEIRWLKEVLSRVAPAVLAHRLVLVANTRFAPVVPFDVPAFHIQPADDRLVPERAAQGMRSLFSDFTLVRMGGPHFMLQARYAACAGVVASILCDAAPDPEPPPPDHGGSA